MGAVVCTQPAAGTTKVLWRCAEKRGAYSRLEQRPCAVRREEGLLDPEDENDHFPDEVGLALPDRPLAMYYDFAEVAGGAGGVSRAAARRGLLVGPVVDLSFSQWFDLKSGRLLEWLCWLLWERRLLCIMVEPPCSSFSPMIRKPPRSYQQTLGFDRTEPKTFLGNLAAFRCLLLLLVADLACGSGLAEQPRMAWLQVWRWMR